MLLPPPADQVAIRWRAQATGASTRLTTELLRLRSKVSRNIGGSLCQGETREPLGEFQYQSGGNCLFSDCGASEWKTAILKARDSAMEHYKGISASWWSPFEPPNSQCPPSPYITRLRRAPSTLQYTPKCSISKDDIIGNRFWESYIGGAHLLSSRRCWDKIHLRLILRQQANKPRRPSRVPSDFLAGGSASQSQGILGKTVYDTWDGPEHTGADVNCR